MPPLGLPFEGPLEGPFGPFAALLISLFLNFFSTALVLLFFKFLPLFYPFGFDSFHPCRPSLLFFQFYLALSTWSLSSIYPAIGIANFDFFFHFKYAYFPFWSFDNLSSSSLFQTKFFLFLSQTRLAAFFFTGFSSLIIESISLVLIRGKSSNYVLTLGFFSPLINWEEFLKSFFADFLIRESISILTPSTKLIGILWLFFSSLYLSNYSIYFLSRISFHLYAFFYLSYSFFYYYNAFFYCYFLIFPTAPKKASFSG